MARIAWADTIEQQALAYVDQLRHIKAGGGDKADDAYSQQMDAAWKFFEANTQAVLPVLRDQLAAEISRDQRSDLVLLDAGYFVYLQGNPADRALARAALASLDPNDAIIRANQQELFDFLHAAAPDHDARVLALIDQAFLKGSVALYIPQHALKLDDTLTCVFLYGAYGEGAEAHLDALLSDRLLARKIIEILIWIGSPDSDQAVKQAMLSSRDFETFVRATAFMMKAGDPQGRAIMLALNPGNFDAKSQDYYKRARSSIEATSFDTLRKPMADIPGDTGLSDAELKKRLTAMYANYGKDDRTSPEALIDSGLPRQFLVAELTRIRSRTLYRVSDEALSDAEVTDSVLNILRYRPK